jgi:CDP-diacylglycerol--glycerol-3-phosphate 3-phosphatidyltransferase
MTGSGPQKIIPLRLRRQMGLAAGLLITPWLLSVLLYWLYFRLQPVIILALFPGLAVAVYIQGQLSCRLATNHRRGEDDHPFPALGAANWITLMRAAAVVGLAGFLPLSVQPGQALPDALRWAPGIIYLAISVADLFDGLVARKQRRETELGKRLDIETDAAGLLVASLVAVSLGRLPTVYLLVGLAYYPFIFGIWMRQRRALPVIALQPRPYARIIAGFQMGLAGMALLPIFNPVFIFLAALIFMTPLLIGFLRDWLVVSCRVKTDADQQSGLDHLAKSLMIKALPLALRLGILAGGIATLAGFGVNQPHLPWQLAVGFCCLSAGLGFVGRSASLFLVMMLGSNPSPFGTSVTPMVIFSAAAALMLTGTGVMSLWAPEEMVLYRRPKNGLVTH